MALLPAAKAVLHRTGLFDVAKDLYSAAGGTVYRSETEWLHRLFGHRTDVFFVQIGAHDGKTMDSIHPFARKGGWSGVLVEPIPYLFGQLQKNYRGLPGLSFENAALAESAGTRAFYRLKDRPAGDAAAFPEWYDQIGSLNKETILSHRFAIPNIDDLLVEDPINCITFDDLVAKYKIGRVDLILIDTEGYDLNILKTIDFQKFRPRLVIYEEKHLSSADAGIAKNLMQANGFALHPIGQNIAAVRRGRR